MGYEHCNKGYTYPLCTLVCTAATIPSSTFKGSAQSFKASLSPLKHRHTHTDRQTHKHTAWVLIQCLEAFKCLYGCKWYVCVCAHRRKEFSHWAILMLFCWCSSCRAPPFSSGLFRLPPLKVFVLCFHGWGCTT